jgi:hypothetical protein
MGLLLEQIKEWGNPLIQEADETNLDPYEVSFRWVESLFRDGSRRFGLPRVQGPVSPLQEILCRE